MQIPIEHWYFLLDQAKATNPTSGDLLERSSRVDDPMIDATIHLSPYQLQEQTSFLRSLAEQLIASDDLVPEPTDTLAEAFENDEYARMLADVSLVFEESLRTGKPFEAWVE